MTTEEITDEMQALFEKLAKKYSRHLAYGIIHKELEKFEHKGE